MFLLSTTPGFGMTFYKSLGFQAVVTVMLVSWLAIAVADRRYRPRLSWIGLAMALYMLALLASLFFTENPQLSFWSSEHRMTGIVFLLHCGAWFLVLSSVFRNRNEWRPFLGVMSLAATAMALWGLAQSVAAPFSEPAMGALGNQSYLAAYLLISSFITGYLIIGSTGRTRILWFSAFILQLLATVLTASRGAMVTLALCLLVGAVGFALVSRMTVRRKASVVVGSLVLVSVLVGAFLWTRTTAGHDWAEEAELPFFVKRIALKDFGEDRLVLWDIALRGIAARPLTGYGGEQFEAVFWKHYDPYGPGRDVFYERWFDKAHNQYLDGLISFGLLGMVPYLLVWLAVAAGLIAAFRGARDEGDRKRLLMLTLALIGYLSYSAFIFDTIAQLVVLYALLAFLSVALPEIAGREMPDGPAPPPDRSARRSNIAFLALAPLALSVIWFADARPALMSFRLSSANELVKTARSVAAERIPDALAGFNPYVHDFRLKSITAIMPFAESIHVVSPQMHDMLSMLAAQSADTAAAWSNNVRAQLAATVVHRLLGEYDVAALSDAEKYVAAAERVGPGNHQVYQEIGEIRLLEGDPDAALYQYEKALGMVFEMRDEYKSVIHYRMACAYAAKRDFEAMSAELTAADGLGFKSEHDIRLAETVGAVAVPGDDLTALYGYLEGNLESYPDHPRLLIPAATIYAVSGDSDRAGAMLDRLGDISPEVADTMRRSLLGGAESDI